MNEQLMLFLGPLVAAFGTWIFARRKMAAVANGKELENTAKIAMMWRELSEGMEKRLSDDIRGLRQENCDLQKRIDLVMEENESLRKQMNGLKQENKKLQEQLKIFNKNNRNGKDGTAVAFSARRRKTDTAG